MRNGRSRSKTYPLFCVIASGSKEIRLGGERYRCAPNRYLLATVDLPVVSQIAAARVFSSSAMSTCDAGFKTGDAGE